MPGRTRQNHSATTTIHMFNNSDPVNLVAQLESGIFNPSCNRICSCGLAFNGHSSQPNFQPPQGRQWSALNRSLRHIASCDIPSPHKGVELIVNFRDMRQIPHIQTAAPYSAQGREPDCCLMICKISQSQQCGWIRVWNSGLQSFQGFDGCD